VIEIRRALATDAARLYPLTLAFATSLQPDQASFRWAFERLIQQEDTMLLVAEDDGLLVGYILASDHYALFAGGRIAWVEELMVAETHRRSGLGRQLMQAVEEWAASRGAKMVTLATRRAAPFYRSIGYEESASYFRKLL
jgi:GNAT superfamily N-acetyltransferase